MSMTLQRSNSVTSMNPVFLHLRFIGSCSHLEGLIGAISSICSY